MSKSKNIFTSLLTPEPAKNPTKVLGSAKKKAEKIIIKATLKAKDIVENADLLDELLQSELNDALSQTLEKMSIMFGDKMAETISSSLAKFDELLTVQLQASQRLILASFEKSLEKVNESLKIYEEAKRKQIDEIIRLEAKNLAHQIVGGMMPSATQEKLIDEAIAQAKKEGVFEQ